MKHLSNLSQNVRVFMAAVALSVGAAGCASGGSDGTGTAGSGTAGSPRAGAGGSAGSMGACSLDDVNKILASSCQGAQITRVYGRRNVRATTQTVRPPAST